MDAILDQYIWQPNILYRMKDFIGCIFAMVRDNYVVSGKEK